MLLLKDNQHEYFGAPHFSIGRERQGEHIHDVIT